MFRQRQEREAIKPGGRIRAVTFTAPYVADECRRRLEQADVLRAALEMPGGFWVDVDTTRLRTDEARTMRLVRFEGYLLRQGTDTEVNGKIVPRSLHETIPMFVLIGLILWLVPMLSDGLGNAAAIGWTLFWGGGLSALVLVHHRYRRSRTDQLDALARWLTALLGA